MFLPSNITLKFGDSGDFVSELQRRLAMVGCFAEDQVNGFYDGNTVNGVSRFQSQHGLHADGVAGPETLRRLNGVIAGDSSAPTSNAEEEAKKLADAKVNDLNAQLLNQNTMEQFYGTAQAPAEAQQAAPQQQAAAAPMEPAPQPVAPPAPPPMEPVVQQAPPPVQPLANSNDLAAMLLDKLGAAPPPRDDVAAASPHQRPHDVPPQQPLAARPPVEEALRPQPEPQTETGLVGKAVQFANAVMQKFADYLESKLSPSVLNEVQQIGQVMARSGVREAPIPTGPEMAGPSPAPARGPEPQQQQIRS